jgi:hypothetical protein
VSRGGVKPSAVVADGRAEASVNAEGVWMLGEGPVSGVCVLASGFFGMSVFTRGPVVVQRTEEEGRMTEKPSGF